MTMVQGYDWLTGASGRFDDFKAQVDRTTDLADWPRAKTVSSNVPIYDGRAIDKAAGDPAKARDLMAEWGRVLDDGPGAFVIRAAYEDTTVLDRATEIFETLIARQRTEGGGAGDHFAKAGANDRVWNALEKHCLEDPANFADYYACPTLSLASTAWLGPNWQMTAQVNLVRPGGQAQVPHRDYHLGFMTRDQMMQYPARVHTLSPALTLQGGIAHCDMPVESGPTMLLPYSQRFTEGYLTFHREEFQNHFAKHHTQLPLEKGDIVFFSPALMHGAGTNRSADVHRLVNLVQVSSAFGRAMESVDRLAISKALYPALLQRLDDGSLTMDNAKRAIASAAEGYAFPTNLDSDPPIGGLAPPSQQDLLIDALADRVSVEEVNAKLDAQAKRRVS